MRASLLPPNIRYNTNVFGRLRHALLKQAIEKVLALVSLEWCLGCVNPGITSLAPWVTTYIVVMVANHFSGYDPADRDIFHVHAHESDHV
jgi:hypothetical protein